MTRGAADLGKGLTPVRPARAIRPGERIHVVGIAGAGASAAALLAQDQGAEVSGCDPGGRSPYTPALEAAGIPLEWRHDPAHVTRAPAPDRLAVTKALTAVDPDNAELAAAHAAGIPAEPWQQVVADAAGGRTLVAVAGTHGKSTTAGWLTHVLAAAGQDPAAFVGALLPAALTGGVPATARRGKGRPFIVEADEYAGNFDAYRPDVAAVTNVDWDHPDAFADLAAVVEAIGRWLEEVPSATLVVNVGDAGARELVRRLHGRPGRIVRVALAGASGDGDSAASPGDGPDLVARVRNEAREWTHIELSGAVLGLDAAAEPLSIALPTAGLHNVANALVVAGAALALDLDAAAIASGLSSFDGVGRRLERRGEAGGVTVYDDYGHHPTAIAATLAAVRQREPGRPVWAVYEPLTFHRTAALLDGFAAVLATADHVAIADIWAGRDPDTSVTSAAALAEAVTIRNPTLLAEAPGSVEATAAWLADHVAAGDVVLVMGGGRSYRIAELLLEALGRR